MAHVGARVLDLLERPDQAIRRNRVGIDGDAQFLHPFSCLTGGQLRQGRLQARERHLALHARSRRLSDDCVDLRQRDLQARSDRGHLADLCGVFRHYDLAVVLRLNELINQQARL